MPRCSVDEFGCASEAKQRTAASCAGDGLLQVTDAGPPSPSATVIVVRSLPVAHSWSDSGSPMAATPAGGWSTAAAAVAAALARLPIDLAEKVVMAGPGPGSIRPFGCAFRPVASGRAGGGVAAVTGAAASAEIPGGPGVEGTVAAAPPPSMAPPGTVLPPAVAAMENKQTGVAPSLGVWTAD